MGGFCNSEAEIYVTNGSATAEEFVDEGAIYGSKEFSAVHGPHRKEGVIPGEEHASVLFIA